MRRKTFDALLTTGGLIMAAVLIVAGALLTWAHNFVHHEVRTQLSQQQIFIPQAGSAELASPQISPYLSKYAGQQLLTGAQAKAYADHYINVHLQKIGGGQTYSQLSAKSLADPTNTKLAGQVQTVFRGETLRGMLLNAYAFDTMGNVAGIAGIVSFAGAGMMLVMSGLGAWHLRRTSPEQEVLPELTGHVTPTPAVTV
jgi:hypothetical protein